MVCPVCEHEQARAGDWCTTCGAYLGLLRRQPHRVAYSVFASILTGTAIFIALAWQVFAPALSGLSPSGPGPWFWWQFGLGAFFLTLGLTGGYHLASAVQRIFRTPVH